jgi:hypothetical protein
VDGEREIFGNGSARRRRGGGSNDIRLTTMGPNGDINFGAVNPAVAYNPANNQYLVAWSGEDDVGGVVDNEREIFGQRLSATGGSVGANDFRLSDMGPDGSTTFGAFTPAITYNSVNNEYLVVWVGDDDSLGTTSLRSSVSGSTPPPARSRRQRLPSLRHGNGR